MTAAIRCVGVLDADQARVDAFVAECGRRGLRVHAAPGGVAVAWDGDAVPAVDLATGDDGSFVVVDGEVFTEGGARHVLDRLRHRGTAALGELDLEAAVTWWDASTSRVTVARDQGGVSPALVGRAGSRLVWSALPGDLLAAGVAADVDRVAIDQLVTVGWVTAPRSHLAGVTTIPAGHLATAGAGEPPRVQAWHLHTSSPALTGTAEAQSVQLGEALTAAVARRSRGPSLGAFLSAGVDSAVIVAILRRTLDLPVETFTFRYHGYDGVLNEDTFAAATAATLGAPHHRIDVRPEQLAERFSDVVRRYQGPISFGIHSFAQELLHDLGISGVLSGSDPGFWHDHGRPGALAVALRRLPAGAQRRAVALGRAVRRVPKAGVLLSAALLAGHGVMNEYATPELRAALLGGLPEGGRPLLEALASATGLYRGEPVGRRTGFVFQQFAVPEYVGLWNHRWARAFGFPIRAPLWDHEVMALADRRTELAGDKPVLRRFAATLLPHDRAYAPKIYQEMPLGHWFRGPLRGLVEDGLGATALAGPGLFEPAAVAGVVADHLAGRADNTWPIWTMLTANEWARQLADRPLPLLP